MLVVVLRLGLRVISGVTVSPPLLLLRVILLLLLLLLLLSSSFSSSSSSFGSYSEPEVLGGRRFLGTTLRFAPR